MRILEWKMWGGNRSENDAMYIWAYNMDDAIYNARIIDSSICSAQWTGKERIV